VAYAPIRNLVSNPVSITFVKTERNSDDRLVIDTTKSLPGMRAVVGGVLVAIAALGTFGLAMKLQNPQSVAVVTSTRDIPIGSVLVESDLKLVSYPATEGLTDKGLRTTSVAVGATTLAPLAAGDLVQPSALAKKQSLRGEIEMSLALPRARALDGTLLAGEYVDVIATTKSPAGTNVVIGDARVLRSNSQNASLGNNSEVTVTLALANRESASVLASAIDTAQVTLIRSPSTARDDSATESGQSKAVS
jgi:Flp pilus assembly protein CpaB